MASRVSSCRSTGLLLIALVVGASGHAQLTFPESSRTKGFLEGAGDCTPAGGGRCLWFSQVVTIPGEPTLPDEARTYNVAVNSGPDDWSRKYPWRAPGTAPVFGSGCGIAGGNKIVLFNGGVSPVNVPQGFDAVDLPAAEPVVWTRGSSAEVAFALTANHGGGYSYRLCKTDGVVNEECFQQNHLDFEGDAQWIQYSSTRRQGAPRFEIPRMTVTKGTFPPGSQWARNPIPGCNFGQQAACGDPLLMPDTEHPTGTMNWGDKVIPYYGGEQWIEEVRCGVIAAGESPYETFVNKTKSPPSGLLCNGQTQFPEYLPGLSGFVTNTTHPDLSVDAFNIVDRVKIPTHIPAGDYLLSWRWDCEQSPQIWQNCADVRIV